MLPYILMALELTENSSVSIGIILGSGAFIVGAIWWASSMQTKIDMVIKMLNNLTTTISNLTGRLETVEKEVAVLKQQFKDDNRNQRDD